MSLHLSRRYIKVTTVTRPQLGVVVLLRRPPLLAGGDLHYTYTAAARGHKLDEIKTPIQVICYIEALTNNCCENVEKLQIFTKKDFFVNEYVNIHTLECISPTNWEKLQWMTHGNEPVTIAMVCLAVILERHLEIQLHYLLKETDMIKGWKYQKCNR